MLEITNRQKTIRFWLRIIYSHACLALGAANILMNYTGCNDIKTIMRSIGAGAIIVWLVILRNIFHNRIYELALIHRPDTQLGRDAPDAMSELSMINIIALTIIFFVSFPVMLNYKLYDPDIPQECTSRHGYNTLLALLVLNSVPIGVNLVLALGTTIGILFTLFIRWVGFWFKTFTLNFTSQVQPYFGSHGIPWHQLATASNLPPTSQVVVLDIELPESDESLTATQPNTTTIPDTSEQSPASQITTTESIKECPVCLEYKMIYLKMKCGHTLCLGCANTWFNENQSCPVCRNKIEQTPANLADQQEASPIITTIVDEGLIIPAESQA